MKKGCSLWLALVLVLSLMISVLAGCSSKTTDIPKDNPTPKQEDNKTAKPEETAKENKPVEMVEISAMVFDRGNAPEGEGTVDNNRWTKWINEQMAQQGVQVKFMPIPRSEEAQKIPVLMASGTAADVMMTYDYSLTEKFYTDGGTYELTQYIEDFGPDLKKYLGDDVLAVGRNENGEQFAIPARRATTARTNCNIRKDWLDKLSLPIPKTTEELYQTLKAFKEKDPDHVGTEKIIAWNGGGWVLQYAFLKNLDPKQFLINSVSFDYTDEGFKEYRRFMNKLYNEGLMDPEYFTANDFSQKAKENMVAGLAGYWEYDVNGNVDNLRGGLLQNLKKNYPDAEFVSMIPVANVWDGKVYNPSYPISGALNFIPKTAKDPGAVVKYLNFLAGEGGFTIFHGIEGEHFHYVDGVPVVIDPDHNAKTKDWTRHDLFLVGNQGYYATEEDFAKATAKELPGWEQYVIDNYNNAAAGIRLPASTYSSPTQVAESGNLTKVNDDYSVRLTTCKPEEFDSIYDEYLAELKKYNIEKIIQERTEYYNKMMK